MVLDDLAHRLQIPDYGLQKKFSAEVVQAGDLMLVKPMTYMNKSGEAVQKIMQFYKIPMNDLWVVHDDLDIKLGEYKIQFGKGPKVHNGVNSIEQALGTSEFWRVRIGIDYRSQMTDYRISGEEYVLGKFTHEEKEILNNTFGKVTDEFVSRHL